MAAVSISGGGKAEQALRKLAAKVEKGPHVRVGFLEGGTEADGTSIPMIAAIQEFGAPRVGIPPRPFFRTMIAKHKAEWGPATANILKSNGNDIPKTLDLMGQAMARQLRQSIIDLHDPPLGAVTVMIRWMKMKNPSLRQNMSYQTVIEARARVAAGKSAAGVSIKPLVDTGKMLNTIDYEVVT